MNWEHTLRYVNYLATHLAPQLNTEQILKESQLREIASRRFATQTVPSPKSVVGF
jgi:hypothetical protein